MHRDLLDRQRHVARHQASDDAAHEAGAGFGVVERRCHGEHAGDHARSQARTVGDGVGDEAGQDRHHQGEPEAAQAGEDREEGTLGDRQPGGTGHAADAVRDGDQQATDHHERDHVGHAVHQGPIETGTLLHRFGLAAARVGQGLRGQAALDQVLRLVDALGNPGDDDLLALEAGEVDLRVGGDDDGLSPGDVLRLEGTLHADRAVRLHVHRVAEPQCGLFQVLGGHVGMGDARWARRDGQQVALSAHVHTSLSG